MPVSERIRPARWRVARAGDYRVRSRQEQEQEQEQPIFILAPHRSCTSLVCSMIGQHSALVDVPETNLATAPTLRNWRNRYAWGQRLNADGLVRAIAEFRFGDQSERGVNAAWWWIENHLNLSTAEVWSRLDAWVAPLGMVEKSPAVVYDQDSLARLVDRWPNARYLHLVRHPISYATSMLNMPAAVRWMSIRSGGDPSSAADADPTRLWFEAQTNILDVLTSLPEDRQARIRVEDLLREPGAALPALLGELGLSVDAEATSAMLRPECSPFAHIGPPGARFGNDPSFLRHPELQTERHKEPPSLESPLPWRSDGAVLDSDVAQLAHSLGYV